MCIKYKVCIKTMYAQPDTQFPDCPTISILCVGNHPTKLSTLNILPKFNQNCNILHLPCEFTSTHIVDTHQRYVHIVHTPHARIT